MYARILDGHGLMVRSDGKMSEFFKKSFHSETGKHPDFQVTSCLHFDSTNVDFAYIESE